MRSPLAGANRPAPIITRSPTIGAMSGTGTESPVGEPVSGPPGGLTSLGLPTRGIHHTLPGEESLRNLIDESTFRVVSGRSPHGTHHGTGDEQLLAGSGDSHVGQSSFLLQLCGIGKGLLVREQAVLETGEEHGVEFQPLGRVQGHERDDALVVGLVVGDLVGVGDETHLLEEVVEADDLARRLSDLVPPGLRESREDLQRTFKSALQSGLAKLDLVTREEFDVQRAVLLRTRGVVPAQLKLIFLADGQELTYTPDADELVRFERTLTAIWAAIRTAGPLVSAGRRP